MRRPKIGILGMGSIGTRHAKNFMQLGCEVRTHDPIINPCTSRQEIINWADAIIVCTPSKNHWHDIYSTNKPLLVEKPIVMTKEEYVNAVSRPHLYNVPMVGYNLRFHSCVIQAKKWLEAGFLGKPLWARFVCAQYNEKPTYLRDGVILNWSHEIDLALYLLGPAKVVASDWDLRLADIIIQHEDQKCQTTIHLDYITTTERRGFEIICEKGSIDVDLVTRTAILKGSQPCDIIFRGKDSFDENYLSEAEAFLDRLDGKETMGCTAEEALAVVDICLRAKEMSRE